MNLTVQTKCGAVEGFADGAVRKWFGIPFAQSPVGELRFKRARPCEPWEGVRECKKMSPPPIQFGGGPMAEMMMLSQTPSEDCLYLNVFAPEKAEKAPVFVWIYGGANHIGEASSPDYELSGFAREGIIAVTFNYRLGPLGFYHFKGEGFESNCAVSDMIAALRWVHENIEAFGGDAGNVTICGESAGGTGVYCLLSAPSARGYFQKAIPMSGLAGNATTERTHELNNKLFFDALGITPEEVGNLKTMTTDELNRGATAVMSQHNNAHQGIFLTGPVIDDLIPDHPWKMLEKGSAAGVKTLVGTCRDEGGLFTMVGLVPRTWEDVRACLAFSGEEGKLDRFKEVYGGMPEKEAVTAFDTDRMFWADATRCALAQTAHATVYAYRFDFCPAMCAQMGIGATHSMDVAPGLDTYPAGPMSFYNGTPKELEEDIHRKLHGAFVAFARTGDPSCDAVGKWEPYTADSRAVVVIDTEVKTLHDPFRERFELWKDIYLYE